MKEEQMVELKDKFFSALRKKKAEIKGYQESVSELMKETWDQVKFKQIYSPKVKNDSNQE